MNDYAIAEVGGLFVVYQPRLGLEAFHSVHDRYDTAAAVLRRLQDT